MTTPSSLDISLVVPRYTVPYGQYLTFKAARCDNQVLAIARLLDGDGVPTKAGFTHQIGLDGDPPLNHVYDFKYLTVDRSYLIETHCINWRSGRGGPTAWHFELSWEVAGIEVLKIDQRGFAADGEVYSGDPFIVYYAIP